MVMWGADAGLLLTDLIMGASKLRAPEDPILTGVRYFVFVALSQSIIMC